MNKIIHCCLEIRNFSSRVQLNISLIHYDHEIKLKYYSLYCIYLTSYHLTV